MFFFSHLMFVVIFCAVCASVCDTQHMDSCGAGAGRLG